MSEDTGVDKLERWLNKEGYPLEFRTAHSLTAADFKVQMGLHLQSGNGTPREMDVVADIYIPGTGRWFDGKIRLICECKYARKKPWIALTGYQQHGGGLDFMALPHSSNMTQFMSAVLDRESELLETVHFSPMVIRAHGIVEAFGNRDGGKSDLPYNTLCKVADVAMAHANTVDLTSGPRPFFMSIVPVIVVNTELYEARFDPKSEQIKIAPIPMVRVDWGMGSSQVMVHVVSSKYLEGYCKSAFDSCTALAKILGDLIGEEFNGDF